MEVAPAPKETPMAAPDRPTVAVVVSGAGARGAYEAGALSELLPWLAARGETPRIILGTSAGALNAVLAAGPATTDPQAAAATLRDAWIGLDQAAVFRPLLRTAPVNLVRYLATIARLDSWAGPAVDLDGLLDVAPLRERVRSFPGWGALHAAVARGDLAAVAAVTTSAVTGGTTVFVESPPGVALPADDAAAGIAYRATTLAPDHVLASAAIPVLFPPVPVADAGGDVEWHLDGGVRLNTPIAPALALGADRLLVLATHPLSPTRPVGPPSAGPQAPDVFSAAAAALMSLLVDRMVDDVHTLDRINRLVAPDAERCGFRAVPYLFVGPQRSGEIAEAAREILSRRYDGLRGLAGGDLATLNLLVGGPGARHAELLSFLLFDAEFLRVLVELGRRDARAVLRRAGDDPWRLTAPADAGGRPAAVRRRAPSTAPRARRDRPR